MPGPCTSSVSWVRSCFQDKHLLNATCSAHVTHLATLYFPGWVKRSEASFEVMERVLGKEVPKRFGIFWNFCINAPRALWDATDEEFGEFPQQRPPVDCSRKKAKEGGRERKTWQRALNKFFKKIVTVIGASDVPRMVKALPHVDSKNPAAGICVLFILGELFLCSSGLPPLNPHLQAPSSPVDDVGLSFGSWGWLWSFRRGASSSTLPRCSIIGTLTLKVSCLIQHPHLPLTASVLLLV